MTIDGNLMEYDTLPNDTTVEHDITSIGDELFEIANLSPATTGLQGGIIFISTKMASHGPRVKFFIKPGGKSFSVSIDADPQVLANSLPNKVVKKFYPLVRTWVMKNHIALENFWHHGNMWMNEQVQEFISGLEKL